jgi:hypothetical protein
MRQIKGDGEEAKEKIELPLKYIKFIEMKITTVSGCGG